MSSAVTYPTSMTVEEFEHYPFGEMHAELVRGEPRVMSPAAGGHGVVQGNLSRLLLPFVHERRLGRVFNDGVGYELVVLPRTVREPDLSFVRADRLPPGGIPRRGFLKMAPDLAVEIVSPSNSVRDVTRKVLEYLGAGARLVWVVDPSSRTVTVYPGREQIRILTAEEGLDAADVLPGFQVRVGDLFP